MSINPDVNWWQFSIDSQNRGSEITSSDEGLRHVNPALPDERHLLTYHEYLGLDKLLSCQVPSSMVPDERCFVITHQLFELVFKLIVFDLTVIAETFKQLLNETSDESFRSLCENSTNNNNFWQPALTA